MNFTPVVRLLAVQSDFDVDFLANAINQFDIFVESTGVPQLTSPQLANYEIIYPNKKEQTRIGTFFLTLNDTISLHKRKLNLLKQIKQGYLQQMFLKNGEKVPRLRFANFEGDFEERKLSKFLITHSSKEYIAMKTNGGSYKVIQQGNNPIIGYTNGQPFEDYKRVSLFGDHTVSLYKPKEPFFIATDGVKIVSVEGFEGDYLYLVLERYKPKSQGYKRHFTILKNQNISFTQNKHEQIKLGIFFELLGSFIVTYQQKIYNINLLKKYCLQKMFI